MNFHSMPQDQWFVALRQAALEVRYSFHIEPHNRSLHAKRPLSGLLQSSFQNYNAGEIEKIDKNGCQTIIFQY